MTESRMKNDSSPLPSPQSRRRGDKDSGEYTIGVRCLTFCLLSLSQRERTKVRDYWWSVVRALAKWPQEHCQVLREPDDSKSEPRRSLVRPKISLGSDRVSRASESHGLSRLIRLRVSRPGNRNPRR